MQNTHWTLVFIGAKQPVNFDGIIPNKGANFRWGVYVKIPLKYGFERNFKNSI